MAALTIMFPAIVLLCWGQASLITLPVISVASIFEQYSSLAQALLLLTIAAVARYYRIPFGRNMRGLVFSLGPYLLLDSMKFASYQVFGPIRVYVELLPAILFTGMLAAWVWAFWDIAPSPQQATFCQADADWKRQWTHVWKSTLSTLGRGPS
ncbi:MAG: hypothetical protein KGL75_13140 [Acidobacteriota bacterium]|nr:hypothetical protein [Acidobacteriota bacterium]